MVMLSRLRRALIDTCHLNTSLKNDINEICRLYREANLEDRQRGLRWAERIGQPNRTRCHTHASQYLANEQLKMIRIREAIALRRATRSPLAVLFRSILQNVPVGLGILLDVRTDVETKCAHGMFPMLSFELASLLEICLNPGLMQLQPVMQQSEPNLKRSVADVEALYPFQSESDYEIRFGPERRVFTLMHPALPHRPLTVLHIALANATNLPDKIEDILSGRYNVMDSACDTAICYSISNGDKGATKFGLAAWTIKKAIEKLQTEIPNIKKVVTLSPIPGFRDWLTTTHSRHENILKVALDNPSSLDLQKTALIQQCLQYLTLETDTNGSSLDPVYRFHTQNGARLADIHWGAYLGIGGIMNSFGMMCQYEYRLDGEPFEDPISEHIRDMLLTTTRSNEQS